MCANAINNNRRRNDDHPLSTATLDGVRDVRWKAVLTVRGQLGRTAGIDGRWPGVVMANQVIDTT
jgi:hypothetical protein